ncbi:MAG: alanine racemase [Aquabacterium sp.]
MSRIRRRQLLWATTAGLGAAAVWGLRPHDQGHPHAPYFAQLARALKAAGVAMPTLVIDRERLHANAAQLRQHVQGRLQLRLVNKSLPCLRLLEEAGRLTGTRRQMVFNLPYLAQLAARQADADALLGKPVPAAGAARFLDSLQSAGGFDVARQVQWLVDTPHRLAQYRDLARARRMPMRINIEIDVGLHRGGVPDVPTLQAMIELLRQEPLLQWSGLMGYDAHTQKIPDIGPMRRQAHEHALQTYQLMADHLRRSGLPQPEQGLTFNTGGSPTFRLHDGQHTPNEVAVGSALVKPSDFDTPLLKAMQAAAFIATPVLKVGPYQPPHGVEAIGTLAALWDPNQRQALYVHGGNWLAHPASPEGMDASRLIGTSSNQQLYLASGSQRLQPDDLVFFRPTQSEAVLQQFGDIAVYEDGRITDWWPVFPARV